MMLNYAQSWIKIIEGKFSPEDPQRYHQLLQGLQYHDYYQAFADFRSYVETQKPGR